MSGNPWHKRYHSDALTGMLSLTLEERGAYQTVLDLIYDSGAPILDNERLLSGYMGCSIRKWRALKKILVEKGKLVVIDGKIINHRASKEIENDAKMARKRAENGSKGGRKKAENQKKHNKNNGSELDKLEQNPSLLPEARSQSLPLSKDKGVEPDSDKEFWANAKGYLGASKSSLIGKWVKDYDRASVSQAITAAQIERAIDPVSYITAILKKQNANSEVVVGI